MIAYAVIAPNREFEFIHLDKASVCDYMSEALYEDVRYKMVKITFDVVEDD